MTPRQKQTITETFPLIREIAIPVSLLFYGRLFDLDPSLRRLFNIDMKEQSKKLISMLEAIVASIDDWEYIVPVLRELGQRHVTYGVITLHYDTLSPTMICAFRHALQPRYNK